MNNKLPYRLTCEIPCKKGDGKIVVFSEEEKSKNKNKLLEMIKHFSPNESLTLDDLEEFSINKLNDEN